MLAFELVVVVVVVVGRHAQCVMYHSYASSLPDNYLDSLAHQDVP